MQERSEEPPSAPHADAATALDTPRAEPAVGADLSEEDAELEELLIREITIDGMCGVY